MWPLHLHARAQTTQCERWVLVAAEPHMYSGTAPALGKALGQPSVCTYTGGPQVNTLHLSFLFCLLCCGQTVFVFALQEHKYTPFPLQPP